MEIPHFVMERKMLLGIKERAERAHTVALRRAMQAEHQPRSRCMPEVLQIRDPVVRATAPAASARRRPPARATTSPSSAPRSPSSRSRSPTTPSSIPSPASPPGDHLVSGLVPLAGVVRC